LANFSTRAGLLFCTLLTQHHVLCHGIADTNNTECQLHPAHTDLVLPLHT